MAGTASKSTTTQSITFTSTPPNPAVVGGTYTVTASGGASGNPVTFSIDPSAKGSCSISGATVTFVAVGTCVIDANQAGNGNYEAATQVQQSFAVIGTQSITFTSTPPEPGARGRRHLHGDGERRGQWQPGDLLDRRLVERQLQHLGCHRHLRRRRDLRHRRQPGRQRQLRSRHPGPAVLRRPRAPRASPSPRPRRARRSWEGTYTVTASGGASGNPVTFSIDASANGSCSISGATVTFVAVGTCVIDANQAGNANYEAATQVQQSFDPEPGTQTITFTSTPPSPAVVGGTYTVTASGGASGNPVTFSIDPSANGICTHLGCHRHLRRRRDLRHRRQPGRQRQLRSRHPGPAVRRSGTRYPDASPSPRPRPTRRSWEAPTR